MAGHCRIKNLLKTVVLSAILPVLMDKPCKAAVKAGHAPGIEQLQAAQGLNSHMAVDTLGHLINTPFKREVTLDVPECPKLTNGRNFIRAH